jgi:hypothetical protein
MDDDYMSSEWTALLGPDDDPSWADWQRIWEAEASKAAERMTACQRRAMFCAEMTKKSGGYDEHL